jgi:hypothetical protein
VNIRLLILSLLLSLASAPAGAVTRRAILPSTVGSGINASYNDHHLVYRDASVPQRDRLHVLLPGTFADTDLYEVILERGASWGLPSIGLSYVNGTEYSACHNNASDLNCFWNVRREVIEGVNTSTLVAVNEANSIIGRLNRLLTYLAVNYPAEGWGNFRRSNGTADLSKIIISGHSQGGGHAAVAAYRFLFSRCVIFNSADYIRIGATQIPAPWKSWSKATPTGRFYSFTHFDDEYVPYLTMVDAWNDMGVCCSPGPVVPETGDLPFYDHAHALVTDLPPSGPLTWPNHNSTVIDSMLSYSGGFPVFEPVWKYMLLGPDSTPTVYTVTESEGEISVSWFAEADGLYQIQVSDDLEEWDDVGGWIVGAGATVTQTVGSTTNKQNVRVNLVY